MRWLRLLIVLLVRSLVRPPLGVALLRIAWRFRRRNWHKRFPFLPLPDRTYLRWRMHTAFGDHDAIPAAGDVERYALWAITDP